MRYVAASFPGFNPAELLEMNLDDLTWWHRQAEELAEEIKHA